MNNISLILAAFMMIFNFCGAAFTEAPQDGAVPVTAELSLSAELPAATAEPHVSPLPVPEPAALTPEPSPIPEPAYTPEPAATESPPSIFDIMATAAPTAPAWQVDMAAYYLEEMCAAAAVGDVEAGREAESGRNAAIDAAASGELKISFDELYLLARVIYSEAGSDWLTEEFRLCVGEVVLNRVASPEYPDSIHDVVYQKGQYTGVNSLKFALLQPGEDCVDCALKLLQGERRMVPAVVYQSDCIQGELFSMYSDRHLGNTYFCLSPNLELYD